MKVGGAMAFGTTSVPEIARWAVAAEMAGADSVWLGEAWRELAVPLAAVSVATQRVKVGAGVMQIYPAHPVIAALQAAQLQELSGGRFSLGLGIGASFVVERWFGLPFERPLRRMREFVEVVRGCLGSRHGEPFSYDGEIFRVRNYRMPFGAELPDIPILVAAVGARMLELAGEIADGVVLGGIHSAAYLDDVRERLAAGAARSERDTPASVHAFMICAAGEEAGEARDLARASIAYSAQYGHYRLRLEEEGFAGLSEQIAVAVRAHDQERAIALVSDDLVDRFTLAGTPEDCRAQAARLAGSIDELILTLVPFRIDERQAASRLLAGVEALAPRPTGPLASLGRS